MTSIKYKTAQKSISQNENDRKGLTRKKNMRMDNSKENTLTNIYNHTHKHTNINTYRYAYSQIQIMYYSSQIVFFDMFESI